MKYSEAEEKLKKVSNMVSSISESTVFSFQEALSAVCIVATEMLRIKAVCGTLPHTSFEMYIRNILMAAGVREEETHED